MSPTDVSREEFEMLQRLLERDLSKIFLSLDSLWRKIDGRPSWTVVIVITLLSSLVVGLLTILIGGTHV